jgi:histone-lysine N-methyltransferase SETD3
LKKVFSQATEEKADTVESFKALFDSVHALIAEEKKDSAVVETNVASIGADLTKWLVEGGGFVHRGLCLERFGDSGNGFVATEEIATGEELFRVPLSHIMSVDTALEDPVLSQLQSQLSVLKQFGSPLLALYLLLEKLRPKSRWKPYLASLPVQYSVPLYWTWEDLLLLRGGTAWSQTLQMWKNAVRLFAVVRHVCTEHRTRLGIPAAPTFAQWRWALAAVFTRRNSIPAAHGAVLALIPVWDMCNHRSKGELTTGFDEQGKQVVCRAMERVESGKQVFIFYGQRSHADLLVNNGFLPDAEDERGDGCPNSSDYFSLRLSLNPNDALFARKKALLEENHKVVLLLSVSLHRC